MECTLLLAEGCNLECKYCYEGEKKCSSIMNEKTVEDTINFICNLAHEDEEIDLMLLGGEPLLNKKAFYKITNLVSEKYPKKKFNIEMTTNATLLDKSVLDTIFTTGIELSISIDGDRRTNDLNRKSKSGKDYYKYIISQIKYLIRNNKKFNVRMTVTDNNVKYLMDNIRFFSKMGVKRIYIGLDEFTSWSENSMQLLDSEMTKLEQFYLENIVEDPNKVINLYDFKISTFIAKREVCFCSAGTENHFVVDCKGNIYPCNYVAGDPEWEIGNIYSGISHEKFISLIRKHLKETCSICDCKIDFSCSGKRCGFKNYSLTGYLNQVSKATCRLEQILYRHNCIVFTSMFRNKIFRFMKVYDFAKTHKIEVSDFIKKLEEGEDDETNF